ncbi:SLAM family member 6-like isoform X1 [Coregonus clupeaformis]|uniref:SLAM family member 6-like isoform X1 n=1 Tax=Coregonus clupeaformis TaxID=59861 RepID=UPI001BE06778|nr:SLAM family member 6-like isoform X1 [Coregonus clupeaformis]
MGSPPLPSSEMKHFLLIFCAASLAVILEPGSGEDDPVVLAVKGGSVQLDVQTSLEGMDIEYIFWRYNLTHSVVRYSNESKNPMKAYQDYENRVGMDPRSYTLELKNLQETDNGIYSAKITDHRGYEKDVARHVLAVHEAVPDVELRMLLLYLNSSEGFCNVSVTCSAHDSYASYTCDLSGCTEDEVVLYKPHLVMTVTGSDGTIMCNASNLVSKKSQWGRMGDVCTEVLVYTKMSLLGPTLIVLDIITPLLLISLILYFLLIRPKHTGGFKTATPLKIKYASIELLHVHEFQEVYKYPYLPEYLKDGVVYSISGGRKPPLPLPLPGDSMDKYKLAKL